MQIGVFCIVVCHIMLIPLQTAEAIKRSVDFSLLGHHKRVHLRFDLLNMAHTACVLVDPWASGIGVELFWAGVI